MIRREIEQTDSEYDREKLQERLAKLAGGVAQVKVGAATETEMKERKALYEDALHATRAAIAEGIVPGGGVALLQARKALDKLDARKATSSSASACLQNVLEMPCRMIAENAGLDGIGRRQQHPQAARKRTTATTPTQASTATCARPASSIRSR